MENLQQESIRAQLLDRRERLATALGHTDPTGYLVDLLQQVDSALERMDQGTYGLCEECHDPVEPERLAADPLMCLCLDHLNATQREELQQDLDLASRIQAGLLPKRDFKPCGWEVHYHYQPAGAVSGDYCDLLPPEESGGALFFSVGDVSGKGVAASLLMAHLHAIFRSLAAVNLPLDRLVDRANRIFCESTTSSAYATLVCGRATLSGDLEICNAGHCPPLVFPRNGISQVEATGLPLGLFATSRYGVRRLRLAPGQGIFLYTDGVTEARSARDEEYGPDRLASVVESNQALPVHELVTACREDWAGFLSDSPRVDDVTIMAIRRSADST